MNASPAGSSVRFMLITGCVSFIGSGVQKFQPQCRNPVSEYR
jgi:hypothetical protein